MSIIEQNTSIWSFLIHLGDLVNFIGITSGSDEVLVDDITKWHDIVQSEWTGVPSRILYEEVANEPHDGILAERLFGISEVRSEAIIKEWVVEAVSV